MIPLAVLILKKERWETESVFPVCVPSVQLTFGVLLQNCFPIVNGTIFLTLLNGVALPIDFKNSIRTATKTSFKSFSGFG